MAIVSILACLALAAGSQEPAPAPPAQTPAAPVPAPAAPPVRPAVVPAPPAAAATPFAALSIPAQDLLPGSRPLEERAEPGPSVAGFVVGSFAVLGFLGAALLVLRRLGRRSRWTGSAGAIKVLARKAIGPKREILLVEVGPKVFMVGSTAEQLSALGEFASSDEIAVLRAGLPDRAQASPTEEFSQSLRAGLREEEAPREDRVFASIADEISEIRRTVRAWRA